MPENTLESLALASRLGCSVVEVDLRTTLDHVIVLNHDGLLEHLTSGMGEVEGSYFEELTSLDAGAWMSPRFSGLKIPRFVDALHVAREQGISLVLDLKDKGMAAELLPILKRENMLEKVRFGGEWDDVRAAYSSANEDDVVSVEPPVTRAIVEEKHKLGKSVIANFSANGHDLDLAAMRAAVAAGVDWINVDYPRLGAEAMGQSVDRKIATLARKAESAEVKERCLAILELAHFTGFPLQPAFERWLRDGNAEVSHAAALALLLARPATPSRVFLSALQSEHRTARKSAAWALGMQSAPVAEQLLPLLSNPDGGSPDAEIVEEALLAISRCAGNVPVSSLQPFLKHPNPLVRGAAALALARHQPGMAAELLPGVLAAEEAFSAKDYADFARRGKPRLSQSEIDVIVNLYRGFMKIAAAGSLLSERDALSFFGREAFRSAEDYSATIGPVAGYQLWDRISANPDAAIRALSSKDSEVANRAEWTLVNAGPLVLPSVREALRSENRAVRERAIRIVAWQEDAAALPYLTTLHDTNAADPALVAWASTKIRAFALTLTPANSGSKQ